MILTPSELELIDRAKQFARTAIAPHAAHWEATGSHLPRETIQQWAALGLNALQVSPARGGSGASFHCKLRVAEALAAECFAVAFALNNMQGSVTRMEREGSADQIAATSQPWCQPTPSAPPHSPNPPQAAISAPSPHKPKKTRTAGA